MEFILIIFMSIGALSDKDSMAIGTIPGFVSEQECAAAGRKATSEFARGTKDGKFVCIARTKTK